MFNFFAMQMCFVNLSLMTPINHLKIVKMYGTIWSFFLPSSTKVRKHDILTIGMLGLSY